LFCFKIQEEHDQRHKDADILEAHIMQAQAAAMAADERDLQNVLEDCEEYQNLGLPPGTYMYHLSFAIIFKGSFKSGSSGKYVGHIILFFFFFFCFFIMVLNDKIQGLPSLRAPCFKIRVQAFSKKSQNLKKSKLLSLYKN